MLYVTPVASVHIAMATYVLIRLFRLPEGASLDSLLLRRS
jgi:hypothetical protein